MAKSRLSPRVVVSIYDSQLLFREIRLNGKNQAAACHRGLCFGQFAQVQLTNHKARSCKPISRSWESSRTDELTSYAEDVGSRRLVRIDVDELDREDVTRDPLRVDQKPILGNGGYRRLQMQTAVDRHRKNLVAMRLQRAAHLGDRLL